MQPKQIAEMSRDFTTSFKHLVRKPRTTLNKLRGVDYEFRSDQFTGAWPSPAADGSRVDHYEDPNPLQSYFDEHLQGPGLYKWEHYFEVYHRHLAKFINKDVHFVEVGIFSGGSIGMWRSYFGPNLRMTGIDIEPACKVYEDERTRVLIGDQEDRGFWRKFWAESPGVDVLLDDGGHTVEQQIVTLEECLPHIKPGGVFICEDVHGHSNEFLSYIDGLNHALNAWAREANRPGWHPGDGDSVVVNSFQADIRSITVYPYVVVIEKREKPFTNLSSVRHGTEWQPHLPIES